MEALYVLTSTMFGNRQVIWVKGCALLAAVKEVGVTHY